MAPLRRPLPPPPPRGPVVDAAGNMGLAWLLLMNRLVQDAGWLDRWLVPVADLASMPTTLGLDDVGVLVAVPGYDHVVRWDGAAWQFAPGDHDFGMLAQFFSPPPPGAWALCDGTATTVLGVGGPTLLEVATGLPFSPGSYLRR
jgi:hypothetical protein